MFTKTVTGKSISSFSRKESERRRMQKAAIGFCQRTEQWKLKKPHDPSHSGDEPCGFYELLKREVVCPDMHEAALPGGKSSFAQGKEHQADAEQRHA